MSGQKDDKRERTLKLHGWNIDFIREVFENEYFNKSLETKQKRLLAALLAKLQ